MLALALLAALPAGAAAPWTLAYEEDFTAPLAVDSAPWTPAPRDDAEPFGDAGRFFQVNGGPAFERQLQGFALYRKTVAFGKDGWLTAELAARDRARRGAPDQPPSLSAGRVDGRPAALLRVPAHDGGLLIRSSNPLPPRYRVEYELLAVGFDVYAGTGPKTNHPWAWGPGPELEKPAPEWADVRDANGFYYLAVVDHPAMPRNNVFIHTRRKAVIDSYNTRGAASWQLCDPESRRVSLSNDRPLNMFFLSTGTALESRAHMKTECGSFYGGEGGATAFVAADRLVAGERYRFAVERDESGYVLEASGRFRSGRRTLRYRRAFVEDGRPVWRYDNAPGDGRYNAHRTHSGPHGTFSWDDWPAGTAYPDYFVIGDPHLNFYEGTAAIANIRLYVPQELAESRADRKKRKQ